MSSAVSTEGRKRKSESLDEEGATVDSNRNVQRFMTKTDIWVNCILPFVGVGCFAFVAGVNRQMKELYKQYVLSLSKTPLVVKPDSNDIFDYTRPSTYSDTFYSLAFSSVSSAQFWYNDPKGYDNIHDDVCTIAATAGNLPVLKWAHEKGYKWDVLTCAQAAGGGHLNILKYAHENGCDWNQGTCLWAAQNGHLEVLKYAHENGCPWDSWTSFRAARNGHLEVLKWAHEHGCPWDEETGYFAAKNGRLEVLKWAHENGCPWDSRTYDAAVEKGHMEVAKWAHENVCPQPQP